ncbi:MAG: hypothetical protein LBH74_00765 [Nitrososphaerota archaeon]|jgi:hypothetical protein|nr:hypothetical protein [Nitrososphaerota archaeon]
MSDPQCESNQYIVFHFKIGVLKELHRRQLLTRDELDRAIKITEEQHASLLRKNEASCDI